MNTISLPGFTAEAAIAPAINRGPQGSKMWQATEPMGVTPQQWNSEFWDWFDNKYWPWREGRGPDPGPWREPPTEPEPPLPSEYYDPPVPPRPPLLPPSPTVPWWQYGGVGGSTALALGWFLADVAALAYLANQLYVASEAGGNSPPSGPTAASGPSCGGMLNAAPPPAKGWGATAAHLEKSACEVAIDEALQNAANYCSTLNAMCAGKCTTGTCKSLANPTSPKPGVDAVSNQTHLFWCGARVYYRCGCYCV